MSECNQTLRADGKAYPRTCAVCKFGPCSRALAPIAGQSPAVIAPAANLPSVNFKDPLEEKRKREAFINAAFTREQQQAIGMILERWWSQKMAGIETQKVAEMTEKMDWLVEEVGKLRKA